MPIRVVIFVDGYSRKRDFVDPAKMNPSSQKHAHVLQHAAVAEGMDYPSPPSPLRLGSSCKPHLRNFANHVSDNVLCSSTTTKESPNPRLHAFCITLPLIVHVPEKGATHFWIFGGTLIDVQTQELAALRLIRIGQFLEAKLSAQFFPLASRIFLSNRLTKLALNLSP